MPNQISFITLIRYLMKKIILIIVVAFCLVQIWMHIQDYTCLTKVKFENIAKEKIALTADLLNNTLSEISLLTESINRYIQKTANRLDRKAIEQLINNQNQRFFFDRLYYITKLNQEYIINEIRLEGDSIYRIRPVAEKINRQWLEQNLLDSNYNWTRPIFDSIQRKRVIYKSLPVNITRESDPVYIIAVYTVSQLYQYMQNSGLSKFGVPYIVDSTAHFIAHPLDETRSLISLGQDYTDNTLFELGHDIINKSFCNKQYKHTNTVTGLECNEIIYSLHQMNAYLGVSVYNGETLESADYQDTARRNLIQICIYSLILCIAIYLLFGMYYKENRYPGLHLFSSITFFLLTISIISIYNRYPQNGDMKSLSTAKKDGMKTEKWDSLRIVDKETLNRLISTYQSESLILYNERPRVIPTGVYVYDIQFTNSHEIKMSGVIWQKFLKSEVDYPAFLTDKYQDNSYKNKGILFPGARIAGLEVKDSVDIILENHSAILYRWNFDIDIGQKMSYSLYPFGKSEIIIPFWSMDFDDNTLLIPDFDSYKQLYPTNMPGLDSHFTIKGWDMLSSCFSYSYDSYLCSFGNLDMYGINHFPELTFKVSISRKFVDILICKIVPLQVILTLLFTLIFIRKKEDGFNNVIGCSGLFFVLVLDHINLRETVLSEGIMYIEFCYFISYIILLLVTITSFEVDITKKQSGYTRMLDCALRNYFWSIISGAMAIISICCFY